MDRFEISNLRAYYGGLLTERQNDMIRMRYDDDMSFGEIAEVFEISRQAVLDTINKGTKHLVEIDDALKLIEKDTKINEILDELHASALKEGNDSVIAAVKKIKLIMEE